MALKNTENTVVSLMLCLLVIMMMVAQAFTITTVMTLQTSICALWPTPKRVMTLLVSMSKVLFASIM